MQCALVGSRYFGALVFEALQKEGFWIPVVVVPAADDRLALAAQKAGVAVHVLANPKVVPGDAIPPGTDLIVAAHTHARVSNEALGEARLGGIGYHPSLLPRHRGIAAVEWTVLEGDPIAGGSVYHLADGWDAGAIAAQDWCFVLRGESARDLWERALAPMGLRLITQVAAHARQHGSLPAFAQDERFATRAPMIRRSVSLTEQGGASLASIVVTAHGEDRAGVVSKLSERARGFGANWTGSRISSLGGRFAGLVHFDVPPENVERLTAALNELSSGALQVQVTAGTSTPPPAGARRVTLDLVGADRTGIVNDLSTKLATLGVSIEDLNTTVIEDSERQRFQVTALLLVPKSIDNEALERELKPLADEMLLDVVFAGAPATRPA